MGMASKTSKPKIPVRHHPLLKKLMWVTAGAFAAGLLAFAISWSILSRDADSYLTLFALRVPKTTTKIYDVRGQIIGVLADEHRELLPYGDIPKPFIAALVATEDVDFWSHGGTSMRGFFRAGWNLVSSLGRRREGGSTLTMQLVRAVTNNRKVQVNRKLKEVILARKLEKAFSKEEILTGYVNEVYFGGRNKYGLEAASRYYFGKSAMALNVEECAFLAGVVNSPNNYDPYTGPRARELALQRRNHVLRRLGATGYITPEQAKASQEKPLRLAMDSAMDEAVAPYAVAEIRKYLFDKYGEAKVMEGGFEVHTTLDGQWQEAANEAIRQGLRDVDRRRGFRREAVKFTGEPDKVKLPQWRRLFGPGDAVRGVIMEWRGSVARVRIGQTTLDVPEAAFAWAGKDALKVLQRGAMPLFQVKAVTEMGAPSQLELDQEPEVEGALLAMDPHTGEIRAMVGGYNFQRSQFNRSWQAQRQVGSTMKAFVYGAAFQLGKTPASLVEDVATTFHQDGRPYTPKNYERDFFGPITIWEAIRDSRNVAAVRTLDEVGTDAFLDFTRKCGIEGTIPPYPSSALGASDLTLQEMVRAYGTIAALGKKTPKPWLIRKIVDRNGKVLEQFNSQPGEQVIDPLAAFQLVTALKSVPNWGTGTRARVDGWPVAGKTGTTQDHTDAWFLGCTPTVSCGVWVGLDTKKTIFRGADGGKVAAPIWGAFMRKALAGQPREDWRAPEGVEWADIDNFTGLRMAGAPAIPPGLEPKTLPNVRSISLPFRAGTAPSGSSDTAAVLRVHDARMKAHSGETAEESRIWGQNRIQPPPQETPITWSKGEDPNK